jgi:alpha-amylase
VRRNAFPIFLAATALVLLAGCTSSGSPEGSSSSAPPASTAGQVQTAAPVAEPAPWWNDEVFYEVFVRSFADSDGDGNGDLRGIVDKLPYLDDLGVTALWLMPITQSPSYHGYDTTDYFTVEQDYGTNDDFKDLVAAAHERDIEVIVDLMLNHTSVEHPWFLDSASGADAAKRDWYVWSDDDPGTLTEWGAPAWHGRNGDFYFGLFWEGMPDLNYRTEAVTDEMYEVARFWLQDMGADGFRLDAVRHLIEDGDQLDGTPETHEWLQAWDDHLDTLDPEALTVGEIWDDTSRVAPYVTDDEVDLAFDFTLAEEIIRAVNSRDPEPYAGQLGTVLAAYPPGQFAGFLANHDQNRVMSQFGGELADPDKAPLAASLLLTLPGVPFLYYGEEIGMVGMKPDEMIRTPMQWDATKSAGFTSGTPWEPVNDDYETVNVAAQLADPTSLLNHYRTLLGIRAEHPALGRGGVQVLDTSCDSLHASLRRTSDGTDALIVLHNFDTTEATDCAITAEGSPLAPGLMRAQDLITGTQAADLQVGEGGAISEYVPMPAIGPRQSVILHLQT